MYCSCLISLSAARLLLDSLSSSLLNDIGTFPTAFQECHNCRMNVNIPSPVIISSTADITLLAQVQDNFRPNKILTSRLREKKQHCIRKYPFLYLWNSINTTPPPPLDLPSGLSLPLDKCPPTWQPHTWTYNPSRPEQSRWEGEEQQNSYPSFLEEKKRKEVGGRESK